MNHRILFFTPIFPPQYSGATQQAITLARELYKKGESICFLTIKETSSYFCWPYFSYETFENFEVIIIKMKNLQKMIEGKGSRIIILTIFLKLFLALFLLRKKYSIIHCHTLGFPFTALGFIGRFLKKYTICKATMSDDFNFNKVGRISGRLHKFFILSFDQVVAISDDIFRSFCKIGVSKTRIQYITNSVDTNKFHPISNDEKDKLRNKLGVKGNFIAVFVGGVTYRKGVDYLANIWIDFAKKYKRTTLVLVGPRSVKEGAIGDEFCTDYILKHLQERGMTSRIFLVGKVKNVNEYLQLSDLFLFSSTKEGMPNVVLEAMSCGLPVISTNVSGISDIISDKFNGEIVQQGNQEAFSQAIERIYSNKKVRKLYSKNAQQTINDCFSVGNVAEKYIELYKNVL